MIQVEQDDTQLLAALGNLLQRALGLADEVRPVADTRETIQAKANTEISSVMYSRLF